MSARMNRGIVLGMSVLLVTALCSEAGANKRRGGPRVKSSTARVRIDNQWHRFVTPRGQDFNIKLNRDARGKIQGQVVVGSSRLTGDRSAFRGGANPMSLDLQVQQKGRGRKVLKLRGSSNNPYAGKYPKYELALRLKAPVKGQAATVDFSSLSIKAKGKWYGLWKKVTQKASSKLRSRSTKFDRSPVKGSAARELIAVLERAGAPNVDVEGTTYRNLRVSPYLTQGGNSFTVHMDGLKVPAQLNDALNGLKSLGLRSNHPIFSRMP